MEALAVAHALELAPKNINLRVFTDNQTIIYGIPRGGSASQEYQNIAEMIFRIA